MGCLVLLRSDYLPIVSLTEIKDGRDETLGDLEWKQGPRLFVSILLWYNETTIMNRPDPCPFGVSAVFRS